MSSCGEGCGWIAAFCSMIAFGTFGVPIKSNVAQSVNIDPLVFQSYKTFMCFITSWFVLLAGEEFTFSPWGIVSGLFWVPGGVATVYAVKSAGLAIGIGIGSSFIVLVSFIWGIFIFEERVHSKFGACFAILCMMIGLFGMSYYSSPQVQLMDSNSSNENVITTTNSLTLTSNTDQVPYYGIGSDDDDDEHDNNNAEIVNDVDDVMPINGLDPSLKLTDQTVTTTSSNTVYRDDVDDAVATLSDEEQQDENNCSTDHHQHQPLSLNDDNNNTIIYVEIINGIKVPKRQLGMLSAAFCGIWGGSIMAPMKFCKSDTKGTHYLISFAIGATIVTISLWIFRYIYNIIYYNGSFSKAYNTLPSFHIRIMWLPGGLSGLLWSIGNFFSLISVLYLGEGVGYPLVQTSILVSGLWGIFYFKEIQGYENISKWLLSSLLTIFGILLLSYEHVDE